MMAMRIDVEHAIQCESGDTIRKIDEWLASLPRRVDAGITKKRDARNKLQKAVREAIFSDNPAEFVAIRNLMATTMTIRSHGTKETNPCRRCVMKAQ